MLGPPQGKSIDRISTVCHMHEHTAKEILRAAGAYQERGTEAHRHQTVRGGKLTSAIVLEILAAEGTNQDLAGRFGASKTQISKINNGHAWQNVTHPSPS